ncbi:amidase, partial [Mesorhizobium sp. M5C.F.Ca.IN.020.29.1.1]
MDSETIGFMPAVELAELIRTKEISPVEYMRVLLARIAELEPKVNAFAYFAADRAMNDAKKAET